MSTVHFRNAKILVGGYDVSGDMNQVAIALAAEVLDETCFGDSTRTHKGGLTTVAVSGSGCWDASAGHVDAIAFSLVGVDDTLIAVFPNGITEGATSSLGGFACKGVVESYPLKGDVGSLLAFDLSIQGRGIEA